MFVFQSTPFRHKCEGPDDMVSSPSLYFEQAIAGINPCPAEAGFILS